MLSFSDTTSLCSSPAAAVALFESTHDDANTSNEGADYLSNSDIMELFFQDPHGLRSGDCSYTNTGLDEPEKDLDMINTPHDFGSTSMEDPGLKGGDQIEAILAKVKGIYTSLDNISSKMDWFQYRQECLINPFFATLLSSGLNTLGASFHGYLKTCEDAIALLQAAKQDWVQYHTQPLSEKHYKGVRSGSIFIYRNSLPTAIVRDGFSWNDTELVDGFCLQSIEPKGKDTHTILRRKVVGYVDPLDSAISWFVVGYEGTTEVDSKPPSEHPLLSKGYFLSESWTQVEENILRRFLGYENQCPKTQTQTKFRCDECGGEFAHSSNLRRHRNDGSCKRVKKRNEQRRTQTTLKCNECGGEYANDKTLRHHHYMGVCERRRKEMRRRRRSRESGQ